jgi:hypothetical protein
MRSFRFCYETRGSHVHVRVFFGRVPHRTHGKDGDLVFSADEWDQFVGSLRARVKWCTKPKRAAAADPAGARAAGAQVGA